MGNRAVIQVDGSTLGIYLHWNGGVESVTAFLKAAKDLGVRRPASDPSYFHARFVQMIANFFGGTASIGIDLVTHLDTDNGDNGLYIINDALEIQQRKYAPDHAKDGFNQEECNGIYDAVMNANASTFKRE